MIPSLSFHWTAICSSSIVFTPRSLFLLFVLLFSGLIVEDLTTAATSPWGLLSYVAALKNVRKATDVQICQKNF